MAVREHREHEAGTSFGQLLRRFRLLARLTQEELAERSAYSTDYISKLERDQRQPPLVAVDRLAEVLQLGEPEHQELLAARERHRRAAPAARPARPSPPPLPASPTPLIGRIAEQAAVRAALDTARLVTLTGVGGTGKTRLALEVARQAAADGLFADGVAFANCAPLSSPGLLTTTVLRALGLVEQPDQPAELQLIEALRPRHLLLVVDTLEHLLVETPLLSRLLAAAPRLHVLATSRAPLHLYGEQEIRVPPLSLPRSGSMPGDQEDLAASEAVQLFVARARAVAPHFDPTDTSLAAIAAICGALDGLPLAIELAAARVTLFPPEALLDRLGERLAVLTGGPRDLPRRQQTLRATLDWSYALLTAAEQVVFARLGIFAGSFDAAAVVAICASDGALEQDLKHEPALGTATDRMLARLEALADQSLVEIAPGSTPRFRLLDTTRAYALERLEEGVCGPVRDRHLRYYRELVEELVAALRGAGQVAALARLDAEHDNLRAALGWARERGALEEGLRLAGELGRFWQFHGDLREGRGWLEALLALPSTTLGAPSRTARAGALASAGSLAWRQGAYQQATALLQEALILFRADGDSHGTAHALAALGNVAYRQGDDTAASSLYGEALALWRAVEDDFGVSIALGNLGRAALRLGDDQRAVALLDETLLLKRRLGDIKGVAGTLTSLGRIALRTGDYTQASALLTESLELKRELGDRHGRVTALDLLGRVALLQGDLPRASALLGEALSLDHEIGAWDRMPEVLEDLAALAVGDSRPGDAVQLAAAATALRATLGLALPPEQRAAHDQMEQEARAALGDEGFAAAWAIGVEQPLEETIAGALGTVEDPGTAYAAQPDPSERAR